MVTVVEIHLKNGIGPKPEVCIWLLNSGNTPALNVEIAAKVWASVPTSREEMQIVEPFSNDDSGSQLVIAPNVRPPGTVKCETELDAAKWQSIARNDGLIL